MTQNDRDDLADKAHLYRGLSEPPSAHNDPPASVAGPDGLREHPDSPQASGIDPAAARSQQAARASRPPREELSYDTVRPRLRGGSGAKVLLGAGALLGAVLAFLFLRFGLGPGGGHGGTSPGAGGAAPNPPNLVQATQPATSPASPTTSGAAATAPTAPLQLTIVEETYHLGAADGKQVSLDEAVSLAKQAKPGSPVTINLIDSSRQGVKEDLRTALERQQIPIIWTRDGKPVSGEVTVPGKAGTPEDVGNK